MTNEHTEKTAPIQIRRAKIWLALVAAAITITLGFARVVSAWSEIEHRVVRIEERMSALADVRDRLARVEAGVDAIRLYFSIPARPGKDAP
jgi:hypothetical protein